MQEHLHILSDIRPDERPERFTFPFSYAPHPWTQAAAEEVMRDVRRYMVEHPESELHRLGKMFGVLVAESREGEIGYLRAFSAMLDGTYYHEGFVGPVFDISNPDGYFKQEEARISAINRLIREQETDASLSDECNTSVRPSDSKLAALKAERKQRSQALQRWMFSQYRMLNGEGQKKDLMAIFAAEKPILTEEEFYAQRAADKAAKKADNKAADEDVRRADDKTANTAADMAVIPPSGAGECCAPKLLQAAFQEGLTPLCIAEFWMGASPRNELRIEGHYYPACQSRCKPILRHMLAGIPMDDDPVFLSSRALAAATQILFEDEHIIAVVKPSGLLTAPGADGAYSLQDWVQQKNADCQTALPAHRLDMDTSGIVLFGKTREAYIALQKLFQTDGVKKRYEAVVRPLGATVPESGTVELPLNRDPFDRPRQRVDYQHGKTSVTTYEKSETRPDGTVLIQLFPQTGRTHQLRVHCAHPDGLNAPILGDRLYGDSRTAPRLMLHAAEIRFVHPFTGEEIILNSNSHF